MRLFATRGITILFIWFMIDLPFQTTSSFCIGCISSAICLQCRVSLVEDSPSARISGETQFAKLGPVLEFINPGKFRIKEVSHHSRCCLRQQNPCLMVIIALVFVITGESPQTCQTDFSFWFNIHTTPNKAKNSVMLRSHELRNARTLVKQGDLEEAQTSFSLCFSM